ncbi:hypothetical protein RZN05_09480 [Sphingomonas sp. HF-S4]|uniref:Uncharacterized protein n=1 Tax=Sphingomonas agrestis TaxID=3080540 RepID=A0ABU3Y7Z3_9SPHN|nr:hypothetical protein [Sphingomonas sp. HF-S4]MDV3457212.1 hypothetical protein [Sphingomonas sp. HF-S4]
MRAADQRATLAAIGNDLVAVEGGPGSRRAALFLKQLSGCEDPAACFTDLPSAPAWLRLPAAAQHKLALRVALLWMGDALGGSIDGAWLGKLAEVAGEDLLDWAIATVPEMPAAPSRRLEPDELEIYGFSLLRAQLPMALRGYLPWRADHLALSCPSEALDAFIAASVDAGGRA